MKTGLIVSAVLGLAMTAPIEEKKAMECKPVYEGTMHLSIPYGGGTHGMKFSKNAVKPYGDKLLELKNGHNKEKSNVEVVVSECKHTGIKEKNDGRKQGTISVKGEKGKCLLHSPQKDEKGSNVLYVGDCKKSVEGLFGFSSVGDEGDAGLSIYTNGGKETTGIGGLGDMKGEKDVVKIFDSKSTKSYYPIYLDVSKEY